VLVSIRAEFRSQCHGYEQQTQTDFRIFGVLTSEIKCVLRSLLFSSSFTGDEYDVTQLEVHRLLYIPPTTISMNLCTACVSCAFQVIFQGAVTTWSVLLLLLLVFNWTPNGFFTQWQWYYNKTQHTNILIPHKIINHAQTKHSTQSYTNNKGHIN
jgi:hypothetical protein